MWTIDNIRKIVAAVGDLVEVDDDVEHMQRLDRARVLVRTPRPPLIQQVEVHAGGETYRDTCCSTRHCRFLPPCERGKFLLRRELLLPVVLAVVKES